MCPVSQTPGLHRHVISAYGCLYLWPLENYNYTIKWHSNDCMKKALQFPIWIGYLCHADYDIHWCNLNLSFQHCLIGMISHTHWNRKKSMKVQPTPTTQSWILGLYTWKSSNTRLYSHRKWKFYINRQSSFLQIVGTVSSFSYHLTNHNLLSGFWTN